MRAFTYAARSSGESRIQSTSNSASVAYDGVLSAYRNSIGVASGSADDLGFSKPGTLTLCKPESLRNQGKHLRARGGVQPLRSTGRYRVLRPRSAG